MRGRVPVGRSNSDADFLATGQQGGAKTHELTQRQMPPHDHRPADGTNFAIWINNEAEGGSGSSGYEVSKDQKPTTTSVSGGYFENGVWKVEAHNNLQPYLVLVFIQRIS
jgi:microcystin-dependent protein